MPDSFPTEEIETFHGGMSNRLAPWRISQIESAVIENLEPQIEGKISRMRGVDSIGAASGTTDTFNAFGLAKFYDQALGQEVAYAAHSNRMFFLTGGTLNEVASGVSLVSALHMGSRGLWSYSGPAGNVLADAMYFTQAQPDDSNVSLASKLFVVDVDRQWSQASDMAPRCAVWWQGRLWCGANSLIENDQTLWWSSLNDGLSFSLTNTVQVEPGRGGRITALLPIRSLVPNLVVFKERLIALFEVYWGSSSSLIPGSSDALDTIKSSIRVIADNFGCVATKSIQYVPGAQTGDVFFLAHDGIRAISRATDDTVAGASLPLSTKIQTTIDRINFTHAHKAVSAVWDQKYFLAVPLDGATQNTHIIIYDLINQSFYLSTLKVADLQAMRLNQTADKLWGQYGEWASESHASDTDIGWHTYQLFTGRWNPGTVPVAYDYESRAFTFGALKRKKRWEWFGIMAYNTTATATIDVEAKVDDDRWSTLDSVTFPVAGGTYVILGSTPLPWGSLPNGMHQRKVSLSDLQPGYTLQLRLTQTSVSDTAYPTFIGMSVAAKPLASEFDNTIT